MAVEIKDVEQVAQELQAKFDDFKAKNDKRIDAIESEKGALAGQVETLNGKLSELESLKSDLEEELTALKRPGGGAKGKSVTEHKAAFMEFVRKGNEDGLRELEQKALQTGVDADDLIEVSGDVFAEFTSPKAGFVRTVVNDLPAWKEAPPLTHEEQVNIAENTKQQLLYAAKQKITGWQTDLLLGDISDEDREKLIIWRDYIRKLEAIDTSKAPDIEWPTQPV